MKLPLSNTLEVFVNHSKLDGLKILHLSDLHINKNTTIDTIQTLITTCKELEYDFAVITGDIIDCKVHYIQKKLQLLNTLASKKPVYYISGNHDIFYGLENLKEELIDFNFMDNTTTIFEFNDYKINITGLADRFSKLFKVPRDEQKVLNFLQNSEATIFLAHQPKDYKLAVKTNTALFLCGHTHGGQIFPFHYLVRLVQPFLSGLFYQDKTAIYVNKGLGTWGIDFRYKADSEITILKLNHNTK
ncbi:MAG: metallophosphoesterase [Arcobacteraceae bacterium]